MGLKVLRASLLVPLFYFLISAVLVLNRAEAQDDTAAVSPKPGWGDFEVVEEQHEEYPWWTKALLWLPNRALDLIDIFRLDLGVGRSTGGIVRLSRYAQAGYRTMSPSSFRIGAFGRDPPYLVESSNEYGVSPFYVHSKDRQVCAAEVGVGADLFLLGAYGGVCLDELVDFVGGIFFLDIKDDDVK
ncbi:MAG: hypothetical protein J5J00_05255 [Deltaproteobacteria bacterium]|nr:hypothetical protein [Deltaproteobacteria bacterium]